MKLFIVLITLFAALASFACDITKEEMQWRQTQLKIKGQFKSNHSISFNSGEVTKEDWESMIKAAEAFYTPVMKKLGYTFKINQDWNDDEVNAYASEDGKIKSIMLYGGYARTEGMTADAYLTIICHEIGHHLGGFPRKGSSTWASSEGQADYFSTLKCMKEILKKDPKNKEIALALDLPTEVKQSCRNQFSDDNDYFICLRGAKGGEDYGSMLSAMGGEHPVSLSTPDTTVVKITNIMHPDAQCRADTKYAGALCNVSTAIALDVKDETIGTCHKKNGQNLGVRPACWFAAKN